MSKRYKLIVSEKQLEAIITGLDKYSDDLGDMIRTNGSDVWDHAPDIKGFYQDDKKTLKMVTNLLNRVKSLRWSDRDQRV